MKLHLLHTIIDTLQAARDCSDQEYTRELILMAQKHLNNVAGELSKSIDSMRSIYENDGFIPAIREWRAITGKGLKEAKEDVERAADSKGWKYHLVGKTMRITSTNDYFHGQTCIITHAVRGVNICEVMFPKDNTRINISLKELTEVQ